MATKIIYEADLDLTSNPADILQFKHPTSGLWMDGALKSGTTNRFTVVAAGLPAGDYLVHRCRVKGTTMEYSVTNLVTIVAAVVPATPSNYVPQVATGNTITGTIPFLAQQWYTLNNHGDTQSASQGAPQFTDGNTNDKTFFGYGTIFNGQNFESWYTFTELAEVMVNSVTIYGKTDTGGSVYTKATETAAREFIGTYDNSGNAHVINLGSPKSVKQVILVSNNFYGLSEVVFNGSYRNTTAAYQFPATPTTFKRILGINGFHWDIAAGNDFPNSNRADPAKIAALSACFGGFRLYSDWHRIESTEGQFIPDYTDGSFNLDAFASACLSADMPLLHCFQKVPNWLQTKNNRPSNEMDDEIVPAPYGADRSLPSSYAYKARLMYYMAARQGSNSTIARSTLPGMVEGLVYPDWSQGPNRTYKVGLNLVTHLEDENERDKWWKGLKSYQTGREYAAQCSASYDGHLNSMGVSAGAKTADPNMKVVVAGMADASTDYARGMIDWCRENRGYRSDGTVNLCWDVMNFHAYPFGVGTQYSGSGTAVCPEVSHVLEYADAHVLLGRQYGYTCWLTETGYDIDDSSPLRPIVIGPKGKEAVRADWALRMALCLHATGLERVFFYETHNQNFGGQFGTSGFLNDDNTRKPQADFFCQAKALLGEYVYQETISVSPRVMRFTSGSSTIYSLHMPSMTGTTGSYTVPGSSGTLYTPQIGSASMTSSAISGTLSVAVTETPVFVKVG